MSYSDQKTSIASIAMLSGDAVMEPEFYEIPDFIEAVEFDKIKRNPISELSQTITGTFTCQTPEFVDFESFIVELTPKDFIRSVDNTEGDYWIETIPGTRETVTFDNKEFEIVSRNINKNSLCSWNLKQA